MKLDAILFDVIGTTVIEKDPETIMNCFREAFLKHGIKPAGDVLQQNRGKDKMEMIKTMLQQTGQPLTNAQLIFNSFSENINGCLNNFSAADGAEQLFAKLKIKKIKTGLGSGLPNDLFEKIIHHIGWGRNDFDYTATAEDVGKARPHPDMIFDMMKKLNLSDKQAFMKAGDTVADIEEGKNAGVITAAVLSGTQPEEQLRKANPDFLIHRIDELVNII